MKVGDLVKIRDSPDHVHFTGIIAAEPRFGVNVMAPSGHTGKKVCEVYFMATRQIATRGCDDLEVINEGR